jgi:hypothetical protein
MFNISVDRAPQKPSNPINPCPSLYFIIYRVMGNGQESKPRLKKNFILIGLLLLKHENRSHKSA